MKTGRGLGGQGAAAQEVSGWNSGLLPLREADSWSCLQAPPLALHRQAALRQGPPAVAAAPLPPHLHACCPAVWVCVGPVALQAHVVLHHKLHHEALLQDGAVEDLGLDGQLHLEPLAVGLSPDEPRVNQLHLLQGGKEGGGRGAGKRGSSRGM